MKAVQLESQQIFKQAAKDKLISDQKMLEYDLSMRRRTSLMGIAMPPSASSIIACPPGISDDDVDVMIARCPPLSRDYLTEILSVMATSKRQLDEGEELRKVMSKKESQVVDDEALARLLVTRPLVPQAILLDARRVEADSRFLHPMPPFYINSVVPANFLVPSPAPHCPY